MLTSAVAFIVERKILVFGGGKKYYGYNSDEFINTCITLFCVAFGGLNVCTSDNIIILSTIAVGL